MAPNLAYISERALAAPGGDAGMPVRMGLGRPSGLRLSRMAGAGPNESLARAIASMRPRRLPAHTGAATARPRHILKCEIAIAWALHHLARWRQCRRRCRPRRSAPQPRRLGRWRPYMAPRRCWPSTGAGRGRTCRLGLRWARPVKGGSGQTKLGCHACHPDTPCQGARPAKVPSSSFKACQQTRRPKAHLGRENRPRPRGSVHGAGAAQPRVADARAPAKKRIERTPSAAAARAPYDSGVSLQLGSPCILHPSPDKLGSTSQRS
jgi:hypothetical protein